jgi:hypothetical protein
MDDKTVKDDSGVDLWHSESKSHASAILRILEEAEAQKLIKEGSNGGTVEANRVL